MIKYAKSIFLVVVVSFTRNASGSQNIEIEETIQIPFNVYLVNKAEGFLTILYAKEAKLSVFLNLMAYKARDPRAFRTNHTLNVLSPQITGKHPQHVFLCLFSCWRA